MSNTDYLRKAAEIIARKAKMNSVKFSRRIPANTHVRVSLEGVAVVTDGNRAPNAAPFETAERHPLWAAVGSTRYEKKPEDWRKQPYRPYMLEAGYSELDKAALAFAESSISHARRLGWK